MLAVPPSSDIRVDTISVDAFRVDCDDAVALPKALCRAWEHLSADSAEPSCFLEHWFALPSLAHLRGALPRHLVATGRTSMIARRVGRGAKQISAAEAAALPYQQIHIRRATLEDVFLHRTGRSLRD